MSVWRRIVFVALLVFAFAPVLVHGRAEWVSDDSAAYQDLANSLRAGRYEVNFKPHIVYPPGFPLALAMWGSVFNSSNASSLVFVTLLGCAGLIAAWQAQRIDTGQTVALTACLLLASSPDYFRLVSRNVVSDTLYLLISCLAILCARRLDSAKIAWPYGLALAVLTPGVVLVRAVGVAWIAGLILWLALSIRFNRAASGRRLLLAGPALATGLLAVLGWSDWSFSRQPPPTYEGEPQTYLAVASYRDPHDTDLGKMGLAELPMRWLDQAASEGASVITLLMRPPWVSPAFFSVPVAAFFFLCGLGLVAFVRQRGIQAVDCYLICYFLVLAAWPFEAALRYVMPVLPFCVAYLWRGILEFNRQPSSARAVRVLGVFSAVVAASGVLALVSSHTFPGKQNVLSVAAWTVVAIGCWIRQRFKAPLIPPLLPIRILALALAAGLVVTGAVEDVTMARTNISESEGSLTGLSGLAFAARQIATLSPPSDVVMAEWCYTVNRWSHRSCVRFPPTRHVGVILDALRKNQVSWLVVSTDPSANYFYEPPEWERLRLIQEAVPGLLRVAQEKDGIRIYRLEDAKLSEISPRPSPTASQPGPP